MYLTARRLSDVLAETSAKKMIRIVRYLIPDKSAMQASAHPAVTMVKQECRLHSGESVIFLGENKYQLPSGEVVTGVSEAE